MKVPAPSLAPILRSDAQGRILARLLVDPEASHSLSDLATWSKTSMPTVQREIGRAEQAGIVTTEKVGPTRLVRAKVSHPLHRAIRQIILATYGPPAIIADEFDDTEGADAVILFGSWAARYLGEPGRAPNDIDVLVIGAADRDAVDDAAERTERRIGLPVQATVRSRSQWESPHESFLQEVKSRSLVVVLVDDNDLEFADALRRLDTPEGSSP
ncbi:MAG: ArsR family transcriptional regulator [Acidimicrobiales bacterium]